MAKCSFCGNILEKGTGTMLVKDDGKILFFCSKTCEKNMIKLRRKPRKIKWTEEAKRVKVGKN